MSAKLDFAFPELGSEERLRELILYVSDKCSDDPTFGAVKLNKILFFADFLSYQTTGRAITGAEYMRLGKGPVPKRLLPIREAMITSGELALVKQKFYSLEQHRTIPLREANLDDFRAEEISLVDELIRLLWGRTAESVSEMSHDLAWKAARNKASIPYQAAFISDEPMNEDDIQWAREVSAGNVPIAA